MGKKQEWRRKPCWGVQLSHLPFSTLPALQKPSPLLNLWNPFKQIFMIICLWRLSFILNPMFIFLWFSDGKHVTPRNVFLQTSGILIPVLWHTGVPNMYFSQFKTYIYARVSSKNSYYENPYIHFKLFAQKWTYLLIPFSMNNLKSF